MSSAPSVPFTLPKGYENYKVDAVTPPPGYEHYQKSDSTNDPDGILSRFFKSAYAQVPHPIDAVKEWWDRPENVAKAVQLAVAAQRIKAGTAQPGDKEALDEVDKHPVPISSVEGGNMATDILQPVTTASSQAVHGDFAGATGTLVGGAATQAAMAKIGSKLEGGVPEEPAPAAKPIPSGTIDIGPGGGTATGSPFTLDLKQSLSNPLVRDTLALIGGEATGTGFMGRFIIRRALNQAMKMVGKGTEAKGETPGYSTTWGDRTPPAPKPTPVKSVAPPPLTTQKVEIAPVPKAAAAPKPVPVPKFQGSSAARQAAAEEAAAPKLSPKETAQVQALLSELMKEAPKGTIPGFATGGVVTQPTIAKLAENEPEAVIPMSKLLESGGDPISALNKRPSVSVSGTIDPVEMHPSDIPGYLGTPSAATSVEGKMDPVELSASALPSHLPMAAVPDVAPKQETDIPAPSGISAQAKLPKFPLDTKTDLPKATTVAQAHGTQVANLSRTSTVAKGLDAMSPLLQKEAKTGNRVVVSIPDKKVIIYDGNGNNVASFPVYVGKADSPTPRGQFRIMESVAPKPDEWYYGPRWLGFAKGYDPNHPGGYAGFHGWVYDKEDDEEEKTTPGWKTSTHGCIQMANPDVARFAKMVGVGDPVTVVDQPLPPPHGMPRPQLNPVSPLPGFAEGGIVTEPTVAKLAENEPEVVIPMSKLIGSYSDAGYDPRQHESMSAQPGPLQQIFQSMRSDVGLGPMGMASEGEPAKYYLKSVLKKIASDPQVSEAGANLSDVMSGAKNLPGRTLDRSALNRMIHGAGQAAGLDHDAISDKAGIMFGVKSMKELDHDQMLQLYNHMLTLPSNPLTLKSTGAPATSTLASHLKEGLAGTKARSAAASDTPAKSLAELLIESIKDPQKLSSLMQKLKDVPDK